MRITVDREKCQGHAMCFAQAPELFPLDDLGYTALDGELDIPPGHEAMAERGVKACPEQAIAVVQR